MQRYFERKTYGWVKGTGFANLWPQVGCLTYKGNGIVKYVIGIHNEFKTIPFPL